MMSDRPIIVGWVGFFIAIVIILAADAIIGRAVSAILYVVAGIVMLLLRRNIVYSFDMVTERTTNAVGRVLLWPFIWPVAMLFSLIMWTLNKSRL